MGAVWPDSGLEISMTESSSVESVDQANQGAVPHPDMRWYVVHAYSGMELSLIHI